MTFLLKRLLAWLSWGVWDIERECFFVGVWTGPDKDLIAVRACRTYGGANYWLSPSSKTMLGAVMRALILRFTGLRIRSWKVDPRRDARWFYTTDGSGAPRRDTWWMPWRVRVWIRRHNSERTEFGQHVEAAKRLICKYCGPSPDYASGWSDERVARETGLEVEVVREMRLEGY